MRVSSSVDLRGEINMKAPLLACAITTVIATAALAASSSGSFSISGGGKTGWSLECTLTKADGSVSTAAIAANNGVVARIDRNDISSAACKAKAPAHGDVTFTLEKKAFNCPYPKDRRGVCSWRMENGQTGDFTTSVGE